MADPFALMNKSLDRQSRANLGSARRRRLRDPENPKDKEYLRAMHPDFDEVMMQGNLDYRTRCKTDADFASKFLIPPIVDPKQVFQEHVNSVDCVCWGPDPGLFLSASHDATVKIWSASSGKCLETLRGHDAGVFHCAISKSRKLILSCGAGETNNLLMWQWPQPKVVKKLKTHRRSVFHATFSSDDRQFATTDMDGNVAVHDVGSGTCTLQRQLHLGPAHGSSFCREDSNLLCSAGADGELKMLDLREMNLPQSWMLPSAVANSASLRVCMGVEVAHEGHPVYAVEFADRTTIFSSGGDHKLKRWDLRTGRFWTCVEEYLGHTAPIRSFAVSPDQRFLVTGCEDGSCRVWPKDPLGASRTALRGLRQQLQQVEQDIQVNAGYPQQQRQDLDRKKAELQQVVAAARADGEQLARDGHTTAVRTLTGHVSLVSACAWQEDGQTASILSSSWDQKIQLFNISLNELA
mmetsp:Transcript_124363/g.277859  ORF Transcript_124363/g.277859 Transcript_124363/m.277859 type:complete len:465 (-) Transcript_124363:94-1488(-)